MALPRSTSCMFRFLLVLVAVWSPVAVRAGLDNDSNGDDANLKLITVPGPPLPSIPPSSYAGNRRFDVQKEQSSLLERRSTTSQPVRRRLPRLNLQSRDDEMRLIPQTVARGTSTEISPGNNLRDSDITVKKRVRLVPVEHSKETPNETYNDIDAAGVHEKGESLPSDFLINGFQAETSYKSCSELTRHALEVIKKGEHFFDWPSLLRSIETCCHGIDQAQSSPDSIYGSMCDEYQKLNNSQYHASIHLKKDWREDTVRNFTDSLVAVVTEAVVAADKGKAASIADGATATIDKLSEEGTSKPISRKAEGRLLVLFVPQINGTKIELDGPGERGEDLARLSILKIIKAKILKSFKLFEKWVSSQTNPIKAKDR